MTAEHVGYMKEPFDTSNYLFYSILKSACKGALENKLTDLFMGYKAQDLQANKNNLKICDKVYELKNKRLVNKY